MSVSTKKVDQRRTKGSSNTVLEYQRSRLVSQISTIIRTILLMMRINLNLQVMTTINQHVSHATLHSKMVLDLQLTEDLKPTRKQ